MWPLFALDPQPTSRNRIPHSGLERLMSVSLAAEAELVCAPAIWSTIELAF
jgi:hypothetical protein